MKRNFCLLFAAAIFTAVIGTQNIYAQYTTYYPYSNPTYIDQMIVDNINLRRTEERIAERQREARKNPPGVSVPKTAPPLNDSGSPVNKLFFKPLKNRLMPKELAKNFPAAERANHERMFAEALNLFEANSAAYNFDYRNIAGVLAMYVDYNYGIYRDGGYLLPAEHQALENDIAAVLLKDKNFLSAADAEKQKMFEAKAIATVLISIDFEEAKAQKDKERVKKIREVAKNNIEKFFGAEIKAIKFTAAGVQIKQK